MAMPRNLKRQHADDLSQDERSAKRIRPARHHKSNFPPEFWDNLSKVWLTPRALRELDRRNNIQPPPEPISSRVYSTDLARFARRGGPDLFDVRGFPEPKHAARTMSSSRASGSSSRRTQSTKATTVNTGGKRSSAYDKDFEQHLIDYGTYPPLYEFPGDRSTPEPDDLSDLCGVFRGPRASLSPSRFSQSSFRRLQRLNETRSEGTIMRTVIPIIAGDADIPNDGNHFFNNLESLTDGATVDAVPDFYDGARPGDIDKEVRRKLNKIIIPSTSHTKAPVAPNFFLEAKAPRGGADVARRQACYDGALGARAIHSLENYGRDEPVYDGKTLAISSTYHDGQLKIYGHHLTAPTAPGGPPECHMTQAGAYAITHNLDTCVDGLGALRNAREWAQEKRNSSIATANARVRAGTAPGRGYNVSEVQLSPSTGSRTAESSTRVYASTSSAQEMPSATTSDYWRWSNTLENWYHRREDGSREWYQGELQGGDATLGGSAEYLASQDDYNELQPGVVITDDYATFPGGNAAPALPGYLYTEDYSQDPRQAPAALDFGEPPTSFTTSFTSSFSTDQTRSKRRQSLSPPSSSKENHVAKSRTRPSTTRRVAELSTTAAGSGQEGATESYWVETYKRKNEVYFTNLQNDQIKTKLDAWVEQTLDDGTRCFYWQSPKSGRVFWTMGHKKGSSKP